MPLLKEKPTKLCKNSRWKKPKKIILKNIEIDSYISLMGVEFFVGINFCKLLKYEYLANIYLTIAGIQETT